MNNENKHQFLNNLPKEYRHILWSIMIKAECNHFVDEPERLSKQDCKIIMRFLYKTFNNINELQQRIDKAIEYIKENWTENIEDYLKRNFNEIYIEIKEIQELLEILGDKE